MFKVDLKNILCSLVDRDLDRITPTNYHNDGIYSKKGIIYEISISVDDYDTRKHAYNSFYVMFFGNTSVFYAHKRMSFYTPFHVSPEMWINTSNHNSCWRSDGLQFINKYYFDMCKEVNKEKAPIELENNARFVSINPINVIVHYKYSDGSSYKRSIIRIERE